MTGGVYHPPGRLPGRGRPVLAAILAAPLTVLALAACTPQQPTAQDRATDVPACQIWAQGLKQGIPQSVLPGGEGATSYAYLQDTGWAKWQTLDENLVNAGPGPAMSNLISQWDTDGMSAADPMDAPKGDWGQGYPGDTTAITQWCDEVTGSAPLPAAPGNPDGWYIGISAGLIALLVLGGLMRAATDSGTSRQSTSRCRYPSPSALPVATPALSGWNPDSTKTRLLPGGARSARPSCPPTGNRPSRRRQRPRSRPPRARRPGSGPARAVQDAPVLPIRDAPHSTLSTSPVQRTTGAATATSTHGSTCNGPPLGGRSRPCRCGPGRGWLRSARCDNCLT